jgi:hypothetical protein
MLEVTNLKLASDIEAVGFYDAVHTQEDIHCLCSVDIESGLVLLFHNHPEFNGVEVVDPYDNKTYTIPKRTGSLDEGIAFWREAVAKGSTLIIHNAHTYDRPVIDKIWPDNGIPFESYHDTFIQSKLQWFERPTPKGCKSAHGLKAWGVRCGVNKPEVTDWSTIDAFKLHRCIEDCKIQAKTYTMLQAERNTLKAQYGIDFTQALKIEALYARECFLQEVTGVLVDQAHMQACIQDLDFKIEMLRSEIEPQLPPTIKGQGVKISRKEMATIFGYSTSKIVEKYIQRKVNGEIENVVEKPFYKPTTNYTNKVTVTFYIGFNVSVGESPAFTKKADLKKWIKDNHPETKTKEWDITTEESLSFVLNHHTCKWFDLEPLDTDIVSGPFTKIVIEPSTMTQSDVVKAFLIRLGWKDAEDWNLKEGAEGNWIKVEEDTEVRWPAKAAPEHQLVKYIPKGGFLVSSPQLSDSDYDQLPEGLGKKIAEYNTYQHRRRFLENPKDPENKGLMSYIRPDGRIPAGVNNFATRSGRGAQRIWVNAPSDGALYGKEIRQCVIAGKGKKLVGVDMKSAQLSIAAYYANNFEYYNNVASGIEFDTEGNYIGETAHCVNARMFGMVSEDEWLLARDKQDKALIHSITLRRKKSKGGSFAVIFGASGGKVAKTIGIPEREGKQSKDQFLQQMGLDNVISTLSTYENTYKFKSGFMLPLAFGYWLWNNSSHKSVNTIVQGFEALAQKMAIIRVGQLLDKQNLRGVVCRVLECHDEALFEVQEGYEKVTGEIVGSAYTWAAEQIFKYHLKNPKHFANIRPPQFAIDLNGGYKVGDNYYDCH